MPGPSSGIYYIRNVKSKYWIYTGTSAGSNDVVTTSKDKKTRFSVQENGGLYTISSQTNALYIGSQDSDDPRKLIYKRGLVKWNIFPFSDGLWNIRANTENLFWFDNFKIGLYVILQDGSDDDETIWELLAA